jgi:hypothetical protein
MASRCTSTAGGNLYVDITEAPIAYDPLGVRGGAGAGWPLPTDAIAIFNLFATFDDGTKAPIGIVNERDQHLSPQSHYLEAYLSGNRIVPCRPPLSIGTNSTPWNAVTSVTLSYLPLASFTSLTDPAKVPAPLVEPLDREPLRALRESLEALPRSREAHLRRGRAKGRGRDRRAGYDIMGDAQTTSVIYEG